MGAGGVGDAFGEEHGVCADEALLDDLTVVGDAVVGRAVGAAEDGAALTGEGGDVGDAGVLAGNGGGSEGELDLIAHAADAAGVEEVHVLLFGDRAAVVGPGVGGSG